MPNLYIVFVLFFDWIEMKKMLFILPILFLIAWCTSQDPKMTDDQIFQKKQECAKYKSEIDKSIESANIKYKQWDYFTHNETFSELFYSPVRKSCLYSVYVYEKQDWKDCYFYKIYDFLSKEDEEIYLVQDWNQNCQYVETEKKYKEALKEFKAE